MIPPRNFGLSNPDYSARQNAATTPVPTTDVQTIPSPSPISTAGTGFGPSPQVWSGGLVLIVLFIVLTFLVEYFRAFLAARRTLRNAQQNRGGRGSPNNAPGARQPLRPALRLALDRFAFSGGTRPTPPPPAYAGGSAGGAQEPAFDLSLLPSMPVAARDSESTCPICLGRLDEENISFGECVHLAHTTCLRSWLLKKPSCPLCQADFRTMSIDASAYNSGDTEIPEGAGRSSGQNQERPSDQDTGETSKKASQAPPKNISAGSSANPPPAPESLSRPVEQTADGTTVESSEIEASSTRAAETLSSNV